MGAKHTPGPWSVPHFADDGTTCNCAYVLADGMMGAVAAVYADNGKPISDGGNDAPPLDHAKANAFLIAAAPDLLAALINARSQLECYESDRTGEAYNDTRINAAIAKALGQVEAQS